MLDIGQTDAVGADQNGPISPRYSSPNERDMPDYRAYTVAEDGHFRSCEVIPAPDDDAAVKIATKLVDGCGVEVWLLDRKVAVLPPDHTVS
jgi:hypothetical protein